MPNKIFKCPVVNESVIINLRRKYAPGLGNKGELWIKCDQEECQYVDNNAPPCPLGLSLFKEEIQIREDKAKKH